MSVTINRTDGTVLTTIPDGSADVTTTNIALIGRLYKNYGELVNENFVKILENFANTTSPSTPVEGQLWYDKTERTIKIYRPTGFTPLARITSTAAEPSNPRVGDLWWDTNDEQLKLYNNTAWIVISPNYTAGMGKTGAFPEIRAGLDGAPRIIVAVYQQGTIIGTFNNNPSFVPGIAINDIPIIEQGLTLKNRLVTTGTASINSNDGLTIGQDQNLKLYSSNVASYINANGSNGLSFMINEEDEAMRVRNNTTVALAGGNEGAPGLNFINDNTTGIYAPSASQIAFSTAGVNRMTIRNNGLELGVGRLRIPNDLAITEGDVAITGSVLINGATTIVDDFVVNGGDTTLVGSVGVTGSVLINGPTTIVDDFVVNGGDTALIGSVGITGSVLINGPTTVVDDFVVNGGDTAFIGSVGVTGSVQVSGVVNARNVPKYICTFNGKTTEILRSHNITSLTRTGVGDYTLTLATPAVSRYTFVGTCINDVDGRGVVYLNNFAESGDIEVNITIRFQNTPTDSARVMIAIWDAST